MSTPTQTIAVTYGGKMSPREIKTFCKVVSQANHDGLLSRQQTKTLIGQAKNGQLQEAKIGLQTITNR